MPKGEGTDRGSGVTNKMKPMAGVMVICAVLAGCSGSVPGMSYPPKERAAPDLDVIAPDNTLEAMIGTHPGLEAALGAVAAAHARIKEGKAGRKPQITAGVDAGWDAARVTQPLVTGAPIAMANLTLSQFIADGGQQKANEDRAVADLLKSRIEFALTGDRLVQELITAYRAQQTAARTVQIIDKHMASYRAQRPNIDAAARRGMMTNSDLIEIDTVVNQIKTRRVEAQLASETAAATVAAILGDGEEAQTATRELASLLSHRSARTPAQAPGYREMAINADLEHLFALQNIAETAKRPSAALQVQARTPLYNPTAVQGYVGVQINWSIWDGGAAKARAEALAAERRATATTIEALNREIAAADRTYASVRGRAGRKRALLQERVRLSRLRIDEMQKLMVAGQSDIGSIAQEIIAGAEAELGLAALEDELFHAEMATYSARGGVCAMISACNLFEGSVDT